MFIETLKRELNERIRKNKSYSLRAYAKDLKVDPSNMSKMLSGKIKPQKATMERILLNLNFSLNEVKSILEPNSQLSQDNKFQKLDHSIELFESISVWYHDAILELTRLSFFQPSITWIAKTLDISPVQVKLAVERLEALNMLQIDSNGWKDISGDNTLDLDHDYTNQALKNLQIDILEKSIHAVKTTLIEKRDHTSTMLTISEDDLLEVKNRIKDFRKGLATFLERKSVQADNLYQLHIGFYPLIKEK